MTGHWIAWIDMPPAQKSEARSLRPRWAPLEFERMSFWMKRDGELSRRAGHHELIDREQRKIIEAARKAWDRTPEMSRKWKSATFSFAPERP
jgi:hypothetical protein